VWRLVQRFMPFLSSPYTEVVHLYRKLLTGAEKPPPRWEMCARTTHRFFGHLLDSLLHRERAADRAPGEDRVGQVRRVFAAVRGAVTARVAASGAFDRHSRCRPALLVILILILPFTALPRQAAVAKLEGMGVQVGTPDILQDRKFLKIMYKDFSVQKTDFFQNILYGVGFIRRQEEHALVSPGEETRWMAALLRPAVSYVAAANRVVVPEYLLQPPIFHPSFPLNLNLGGLGVMLARAVVDGAVGRGAVFTAAGRLLGPGSPGNFTLGRPGEPGAVLARPATCLVERWGAAGLDTPDMLSRSRTDSALGLAGLETALAALETALQTEGGALLPALEGRDPQAVLLLQHARLQCEAGTLQARDLARTVGGRLLGRERLRAELTQLPAWSHYLFCPEPAQPQCGPVL
jgi:hypothetical protein